jgi:hypothetical protein
MKEMTIAGYEFIVPQRILSVKTSETTEQDGEYVTEFEINTQEGETHVCYIAVQVCEMENGRMEHSKQMGCYLSGEYSTIGILTLDFSGDEFINPFEYNYYDKEKYIQEMDDFVNDLSRIAIWEAEEKADADKEAGSDEDNVQNL